MRSMITNRKVVITGLAMILLLIFFLSSSALAGSITVTTTSSTSYFEVNTSGSTWGGQSAPFHTTSDGQVAYCLAEKSASPNGNTYSTTDILSQYSSEVQTGLRIILEAGYPLGGVPSGLTAAEARYATANAIRFWLRENGDTNFYNYENLGSYTAAELRSGAATGQIGRVRAADDAYIPVLKYFVELLIAARSQQYVDHSITFSPSALNLTFNGTSFVGNVTVTSHNNKYGYQLSGLPANATVTGYTGKTGDILSITIPADVTSSGQSYSMETDGYDDAVAVNVFAIAPTNDSYQKTGVVKYGDPFKVLAGSGSLQVTTPSIADLTITSLTTDASTYTAGDTVTVTATVKNQGKAAANSFVVRLSSSPSVTTQDKTISLAAGASTNVTYTFTAPTYTKDTAITLTATADATGVITELNSSNNTKTASITVKDGRPDLDITSLTTDSSSYEYNDTVTVSVVVKNIGYTTASNFIVRITTSPTTATQNKTVTSLTSGSSTTLTYTFAAPLYTANTSMTITATADVTDVVDEISESNNTATKTITINAGRPDLDITSLTTDSSSYDYNDTVTVTVVVKNIGYTTASNFIVRLTTSPTTSTQNKTVTSLTVGSSTTLTYTFTAPLYTANTSMTITATADATNVVDEVSESNNTATKTITITDGRPDLDITSLATDSTSYDYNDTVTVTVVVKNIGYTTASNFIVRLTTSPTTSTQNKTVTSLTAGSSTTLTYTFTAPLYTANTSMTITATADVTDVVDEISESNNTATKAITINAGPADLIIYSMATDSSSYLANDIVTVTVVVKNQGYTTASNFVVRLTTSPVTSTMNKTVTSLVAGASTTLTYTFTVPSTLSGTTMTLTATADATGIVPELVETNNTATKTIKINAAPNVTITNTPTKPNNGGSVSISVTPDDADDASVTLKITWQPMGVDNNTPGTTSTVYNSSQASGTAYTFSKTSLPTGYYKVVATATDPGGLTDTATKTIQVNGPPSVAITNTPAEPNAGGSVSVSVTPTDADDANVTLKVTWQPMGIDNATAGTITTVYNATQNTGAAYTFSKTSLTVGYYKVSATVTDVGELSASSTKTIHVNAGPVVTITNTPVKPNNGGSVSVSVTPTDADDASVTLNVTWQPMGVNNSAPGTITTIYNAAQTSGTIYTFSKTALPTGYYKVVATATDAGGLADTETQTIQVNGPPSLTITNTPAEPNVGGTVSVSVTLIDADDATNTLVVTWQPMGIDNATAGTITTICSASKPTGTAYTFSKTALAAGYYKISATTTDAGGLSASSTKTIHVNSAPTVTMVYTPTAPPEGGTVNVTATPTDPDGGIVTFVVTWQPMGIDNATPGTITTIKNTTTWTSGTPYAFSRSSLAAGYYNATATVTDPFGLTATITKTVRVSSGPSVEIDHTPYEPNVGHGVDVTVSPEDPFGGDLALTVTWQPMGNNNNTPGAITTVFNGMRASGNAFSFNEASLDAGYYKVSATVTNSTNETDTDTETIHVNSGPSVTISSDPQPVPVEIGITTITVTPHDPDGDTVGLTIFWQPMGTDNSTPGAETLVVDGYQASGNSYVFTETGLTEGYYSVTATVRDPGGMSATTLYTVAVVVTNRPPHVNLYSDKPSYVESDHGVFSALVTDPDGDDLHVRMTTQDLGQLGEDHGPVTTVYSGTVASGTVVRYTIPYMIPHPLKVTVTVTDPGDLSDSDSLTVQTIPKPIQGTVYHTDKWEAARQSYNAWALATGLGEQRPPELFFRGEKFMLSGMTSLYLNSNYVHVYIKEYPQYETYLTTVDGYNWTGSIPGSDMRWWPPQQLTFIFENHYVDGTETADEVVVNFDAEEYFMIHELY